MDAFRGRLGVIAVDEGGRAASSHALGESWVGLLAQAAEAASRALPGPARLAERLVTGGRSGRREGPSQMEVAHLELGLVGTGRGEGEVDAAGGGVYLGSELEQLQADLAPEASANWVCFRAMRRRTSMRTRAKLFLHNTPSQDPSSDTPLRFERSRLELDGQETVKP